MRVTTTVNGERRTADDVWEGESLLYVLRERMGLPGSKNACEQGECGSCTVYLDGLPVCACLVAAGQAEGREIGHRRGPLRRRPRCTRSSRRSSRRAPCSAASAPPACWSQTHDLLAREPRPTDPEIREALAGNLCRCTGYEKILDAVRLAAGRRPGRPHEHHGDRRRPRRHDERRPRGARPVATSWSRATGSPRSVPGPASEAVRTGADRVVDGGGCLLTPGLVNTHHHLYQWVTRGLAVDETLFGWLTDALPGVGPHRRARRQRRRPRWSGLAGPHRLHDEHRPPLRVPPRRRRPAGRRDRGRARGRPALPPHPRLDGPGRAHGGLPPDHVVEDLDDVLLATEAAIDRYHDPSPGSMLRIGVAPCSPFSVTARPDARGGGAGPARACGCTPTSPRRSTRTSSAASASAAHRWSTWRASAGWAPTSGSPTACTSTTTRSTQIGGHRHRCGALPLLQRPPRRRASPRARDLRDAGVPVGLGVDGAASTRRPAWSRSCARRCCSPGRAAGPPR